MSAVMEQAPPSGAEKYRALHAELIAADARKAEAETEERRQQEEQRWRRFKAWVAELLPEEFRADWKPCRPAAGDRPDALGAERCQFRYGCTIVLRPSFEADYGERGWLTWLHARTHDHNPEWLVVRGMAGGSADLYAGADNAERNREEFVRLVGRLLGELDGMAERDRGAAR